MRVIPFGGGEVIGDAPDRRVEILCEEPGVHATFTRLGPGRDGADLHVHHLHHDVFVVLAGSLLLKLRDGGSAVAAAGTIVCVPPHVAHGFANASTRAELTYLNLHAPGTGFADYMRGLRDGVRVPFDQHDPPATEDATTPTFTTTLELPHLTVNAPAAHLPLRCAYLPDGTWITHAASDPGGALLITAQN